MSFISTLWKMPSTAISTLAVIVAFASIGVATYQETIQLQQVVIASSPAKAELSLDGKKIGSTPITVELKKGTYTLEAKKDGYEPLEHAVYVSSKRSNIVNIQLLPSPSNNNTKGVLVINDKGVPSPRGIKGLESEIKRIKDLIISNPEEAATIPILNERMRSQGVEVKALREEIKGLKDQSKWYLGSMIAIIVGLMGVIASLFIASKGK